MDVPMEVELCQAFSEMLQSSVEDVDAEDEGDPHLCSLYVKDIFHYLRQLEAQQRVSPFYLDGTELNGRMRAILVDWLVEVHARFQLLQETLYMTVAIMDRYLQAQPVSRKELQLVGVTAMFLAAKYEEIYAPSILDFVYMTDEAYKSAQIRAMEKSILKELSFVLGRPLPLHFLRRAAKVSNGPQRDSTKTRPQGHLTRTRSSFPHQPSMESYLLAKYLMELSLVDYAMVHYNPSEVAAAALCLSLQVLTEGQWVSLGEKAGALVAQSVPQSPWTAPEAAVSFFPQNLKLCFYTGYAEENLSPIMEHMAKNVLKVNKNLTKQLAVKKKYASSKFLGISNIPQLNSSTIKDLAAPLLGASRPPV
ncbi:hypothetical protein JD844_014046 [Phrynosoma platyrhinos]|uniref:Cyclin B2 n=1 Tax=Phrynosoma platyrhinos TaxID=52577 RepID=A0ABQ7SR67_PHRPL|nr:hypothetical protein JD844_014046 [Phrynosoma platyrhinos]